MKKQLSDHPAAVAGRMYRAKARAEGRLVYPKRPPSTPEQKAIKAAKSRERRAKIKAELEAYRALMTAKESGNE